MSPTSGEEPNGTEITPYSYLDTGLMEGRTYYYSIFAVNDDGMYSGITIGMETTGPDTDGDGLSDYTEVYSGSYSFSPAINSYPPSLVYRSTNPDCDGDGINDGTELAQVTYPCSNGDSTPPVVTVNHFSENASSGIIDLEINVVDEESLPMPTLCYVRQLLPGMTEEEFLRKPFGTTYDRDLPIAAGEASLNKWIYDCRYPLIFSNYLGKRGGGLPDRFAIWGRDSYGNVSEPIFREFKAMEAKVENSFMANPMYFDVYNQYLKGMDTVIFDQLTRPKISEFTSGITQIPFWDSGRKYYKNIGHVIPIKNMQGSYNYKTYNLSSFITLSNNVASYYEPTITVPGAEPFFLKKNDVAIDYQFSKTRPQAVHFPTQSGLDSGITALYSGSTNLQQSIFKVEGGYLSVLSNSVSGIPTGFYPSLILPYDFGQGFGLINGIQFQEYALDSWTSTLYKSLGIGITDNNFSDVISIDKLNQYNPQYEAEIYSILKSTSPTDLKILFRNPGDLNFTSIQLNGIPNGFIGFKTMFVSYMNFSGFPVYYLYLHGRKNPNINADTLIRYKVLISGGIPNIIFDREIDLNFSRADQVYFDKSGRYLITFSRLARIINVYLMTEQIPKLIHSVDTGSILENLQLAFIPKEPVNVDNIGGYSKIRLI
ncbi:hypothetical protein, partial [Leptospira meyeri]